VKTSDEKFMQENLETKPLLLLLLKQVKAEQSQKVKEEEN